MQIRDEHIKFIRESLSKVQDKRDLVDLFHLGENLLFGEQQPKIKLKTLTFYAHPYRAKNRYHTFTIKKKSGKDRIINAPNEDLKYILRVLNFILQAATMPHRAATGFVLGKSIVDNACMHVGKRYVYNMDLKDFFHSFDRKRVKSVFMRKPFNFTGDKEPLAYLLSGLVTHPFEIDGETYCVLPQGSPTSPTLTNLLSKKLDRRLTGLANRFGLTYTRYADDISFSSNHNIYRKKEFLDELERIITELDLEINPEKTRLQYMTYQQEITGLIVNEKVNVKRRYIKQIRQWLYFWERYGYAKAQELFLKAYKADKGHVKKGNPDLQAVLDGKLLYLKMVKGVTDPTYIKLQNRLNRLVLNITKDGNGNIYYDKNKKSPAPEPHRTIISNIINTKNITEDGFVKKQLGSGVIQYKGKNYYYNNNGDIFEDEAMKKPISDMMTIIFVTSEISKMRGISIDNGILPENENLSPEDLSAIYESVDNIDIDINNIDNI